MKLFIVGRRAPHISRHAAHQHLLHVHGPMVMMAPPGSGPLPSPYVQNHVRDGMYPAGDLPLPREIDLVTEINFADRAEMQAGLGSAYYREMLAPDEPRFVDTRCVARLPVDRTEQVDGVGGTCKIIALALAGCDGAALRDAFAKAALGRQYRIHRLVAGAGPCPAMLEGWADSIDSALLWGAALPKAGVVILAAAEFTASAIQQNSSAPTA